MRSSSSVQEIPATLSGFLLEENHILANLSALVAIVAILLGGLWFFRRRENKPRINLNQDVNLLELDNVYLVQVKLSIVNVGKIKQVIKPLGNNINCVVLERIPENITSRQYNSEHEYEFEKIDEIHIDQEIHIEPSETSEVPFEFTVDKCTEVLKVYSFIENPKFYWWNKYLLLRHVMVKLNKVLSREIKTVGWSVTTIKELSND